MTTRELLEKPVWDYHDVMEYCGVKKSKAYQIMAVCKEKLNGAVLFNKHAVKRDSVLEYCGTDIEREAYAMRTLTKTEDMT